MTSLTALATESQAWLILRGICGILLLLVGGAVIRLGVVLTGLVIGTLAGWMIWAGLEVPVPSWLMMILGAIVCICLALLLSRFVTALLLGIVLATWLITLVLTWSVFDPKLESPVQPVSTWMALTLSLHQNPDQQPPIDENDAAHAGIVMHQSITKCAGCHIVGCKRVLERVEDDLVVRVRYRLRANRIAPVRADQSKDSRIPHWQLEAVCKAILLAQERA